MYGTKVDLKTLLALKKLAYKFHNHKKAHKLSQYGDVKSNLRGRGMEFSDLRNYQAGDEIRHMAWRLTARTGRPHVKLYSEEREKPILLLIDFNPSMYFGTKKAFKSVIAAYLAATIVWTAMKQQDKIGALICSTTAQNYFSPQKNPAHVLPLLAALSKFTHLNDHAKPKLLSFALKKMQQVVRPGAIVIIISDFYHFDEKAYNHLFRLSQNNDVLAYHIYDPLEKKLPKAASFTISNGIKNSNFLLNNSSIEKYYLDYWQNRIKNLQYVFNRLKISYYSVDAMTNLPNIIKPIFD